MPHNGRYERTALATVAAHHAVAAAQGNRARAIRAALGAGHSSRSLAPLLGVGHSTVARWARDARYVPPELYRITAQAMSLQVEWWPEMLERLAWLWERAGDWQRANWVRSQAQEILACFARGGSWPEVFGL